MVGHETTSGRKKMLLRTHHERNHRSICTLSFLLISQDGTVLRQIKHLASYHSPSVVGYGGPPPGCENLRIVRWYLVLEYGIGFYLLAPTSLNHWMALRNKFFGCIAAGLAVCIGPSVTMAEIVRQYRLGWVARSFEPKDVTEMLNQITYDQLLNRRLVSREMARKVNAATEMGKLLNVYDLLFRSTGSL
jgi:hypothetical protein